MSLHDLLTDKQAAGLLGVSKSTLSSWRYTGKGPVYFKVGKAVRYDPAKLADWIQKSERTSTGA